MTRRQSRSARPWAAATSFAVVLCLVSTTDAGAQSQPTPPAAAADREGDRWPSPLWERDNPGAGAATTAGRSGPFVGFDGNTYDPAPVTTPGRNGTLFYGEEFDTACGDGVAFDRGMKNLATLARIIEKSGRKVYFTVAPNKSAVNKPDLEGVEFPHGSCDRQGLRHQDKALDTFRDRNYLPLRKNLAELAADGRRQLYWHIDTHWTTVGNTRWAEALAARLDPAISQRQTYRGGRRTIVPDIATLIGQPDLEETARARLTTTNVRVRTAPGSDGYDPIIPVAVDHSWITKPKQRALPGRTLVIGDSFSYVALESIRPLFRRGRFLWIGQLSLDTIVDAIPKYDTVVIEVVQRFLSRSVMTLRSTRQSVRSSLTRS